MSKCLVNWNLPSYFIIAQSSLNIDIQAIAGMEMNIMVEYKLSCRL